jgi:hypothetical protein
MWLTGGFARTASKRKSICSTGRTDSRTKRTGAAVHSACRAPALLSRFSRDHAGCQREIGRRNAPSPSRTGNFGLVRNGPRHDRSVSVSNCMILYSLHAAVCVDFNQCAIHPGQLASHSQVVAIEARDLGRGVAVAPNLEVHAIANSRGGGHIVTLFCVCSRSQRLMPKIFHYRHRHGTRAVVAASTGLPGNPIEWTFEKMEEVDPNSAPGSEAARWLEEIERVGHCIEKNVAEEEGVPPPDANQPCRRRQ